MGEGGYAAPQTSGWKMVSQSGEKILHKSLLGILDSDSSTCSDGDGNNGDDEYCDSGESFSDEFISFPVVTASLMVIYEYWKTWDN